MKKLYVALLVTMLCTGTVMHAAYTGTDDAYIRGLFRTIPTGVASYCPARYQRTVEKYFWPTTAGVISAAGLIYWWRSARASQGSNSLVRHNRNFFAAANQLAGVQSGQSFNNTLDGITVSFQQLSPDAVNDALAAVDGEISRDQHALTGDILTEMGAGFGAVARDLQATPAAAITERLATGLPSTPLAAMISQGSAPVYGGQLPNGSSDVEDPRILELTQMLEQTERDACESAFRDIFRNDFEPDDVPEDGEIDIST